MLDTLAISKQLQESGLSTAQADAIASMMSQMMKSELATKAQLDSTSSSQEKKQEILKTELDLKITGIEKEVKTLNLKITSLEKDIKAVDGKITSLEINLANKMNSHLKWVAGFMVGQTALLFALVKLLG